jgi:ribonuclease HII
MLERCFRTDVHEAGCDEAGRGCLAGPVVAAAVILPPNFMPGKLNDSKKLTQTLREQEAERVKAAALDWAVGVVSNEEIDRINILKASFLAMHRAIDQLKVRPGHLLIDGNRFTPYPNTPHACMVKGDGRFLNIAAASVIAKTTRDYLMAEWHLQHPQYGWDRNKGYPTKSHREAIFKNGITPLHRKTFTLLPNQLRLPLD